MIIPRLAGPTRFKGGAVDTVKVLVALVVGCALLDGCDKKPCSNECDWHGLCTPQGGDCHAATDADCHPSKACRWYGRCTAREGKCVTAKHEDCRISNKCKQAGQCQARKGKCIAVRQSDCKASTFCAKSGLCKLTKKGTCNK